MNEFRFRANEFIHVLMCVLYLQFILSFATQSSPFPRLMSLRNGDSISASFEQVVQD